MKRHLTAAVSALVHQPLLAAPMVLFTAVFVFTLAFLLALASFGFGVRPWLGTAFGVVGLAVTVVLLGGFWWLAMASTAGLYRRFFLGEPIGWSSLLDAVDEVDVEAFAAGVFQSVLTLVLVPSIVGPAFVGFVLFYGPVFLARGNGLFAAFRESVVFSLRRVVETCVLVGLLVVGVLLSPLFLFVPLAFFSSFAAGAATHLAVSDVTGDELNAWGRSVQGLL